MLRCKSPGFSRNRWWGLIHPAETFASQAQRGLQKSVTAAAAATARQIQTPSRCTALGYRCECLESVTPRMHAADCPSNPKGVVALLSMGPKCLLSYHGFGSNHDKAIAVDRNIPPQLVSIDGMKVEDPVLCDEQCVDSAHDLDLAYVSFGSRKDSISVDWLRDTFTAGGLRQFVPGKCLRRNGLKFSVLFVVGHSVRDFIMFSEQYDRDISDCIKIACIPSSTPDKRARLLLGGFDDVFDIGRMQGVEARARVDAIVQRYMQVRVSRQLRQLKEKRLNQVAPLNQLTNRELDLIEIFVQKEGEIVPYEFLMERMQNENGPINMKHLGVIIFNLRRKLLNGYQLSGVRSEGYVLHGANIG